MLARDQNKVENYENNLPLESKNKVIEKNKEKI